MKIKSVQNAVMEHYGIDSLQLMKAGDYRKMAIHLCLAYPMNTTSKVARYFDIDHTSVVRDNANFKIKLKQDSDLRQDKEDIIESLKYGRASTLDELIQQNIDRAKKLRHTD